MTTKNETTMNDFNATIGNTVLCDGFLIPMTDFVIEIDENKPKFKNFSSFSEINQYEINGYDKIRNYATFLKQPLKLEMFVPCDEDGNVLEEYKRSEAEILADKNSYCRYISKEEAKWNKAKEKVLFELNSPVAVETMNYHISRNRNIEYLAKFGSIKLTQNSLNAIFGKTGA